MRYTILRPGSPTDPRALSFASLEHLRAEFPSVLDCELESEAAERVRDLYPDALVMPLPIKLGAGETMLLGVIENLDTPHDADGTIPFVLFVQAISQNSGDQYAIRKNKQWSRSIWKVPVVRPRSLDYGEVKVELRATDLDQPTRLHAKVFRRADDLGARKVVYLELNGIEMSLEILADYDQAL